MNRRGSYLVATGIFLSRIAGLVRQRVLSHYLGISGTSDIWNAAFRIPNFLQNLLGEGALSASFIPAYARLLGEDRHEEARRLASAVLGLLMTVVSVIVLVGVAVAPWMVAAIEPGFSDDQQQLTTMIVRILFPATGLLVISAWCLGVLNSHRQFLLSYAAPVAWNFAIIVTILLFAADRAPEQFIVIAAIGAVIGGVLQVAVQWPSVRGVAGPVVPTLLARGARHPDRDARVRAECHLAWRQPDIGIRRPGTRVAHLGRHHGDRQRADPLHAAGVVVRDRDLGGGASGNGAGTR